MAELNVPAKTIDLSMEVSCYLPIMYNQGAGSNDGLYGEPTSDPSIIYIAADDSLLLSFSFTEMIDDFIEMNTTDWSPKFEAKFKPSVIALRDYLIKQAATLNAHLPDGDAARILISVESKE